MPENRKSAPMRLAVTDLALELTRRCNMKCEHCMRSDAEGVDMARRTIENVFMSTAEIMTLTLTGGEPSLVPDLIRFALRCAKKYGTKVSEVYIATNGKEVSEKFLSACRAWHMKCLSDMAPNSDRWVYADGIKRIVDLKNDCEPTGVFIDISMDRFHDDIPRENVLKLCTLPNVRTDKYRDARDDSWVLHVGRACWNGIGDDSVEYERPWAYGETAGVMDIEKDARGYACYEGMIYVNACGQVLKYCDYSYEEQDEHVMGEIDPVQPDPGWVGRLYEAHKDDQANYKKTLEQQGG